MPLEVGGALRFRLEAVGRLRISNLTRPRSCYVEAEVDENYK